MTNKDKKFLEAQYRAVKDYQNEKQRKARAQVFNFVVIVLIISFFIFLSLC